MSDARKETLTVGLGVPARSSSPESTSMLRRRR
jgi:hypothetical protein